MIIDLIRRQHRVTHTVKNTDTVFSPVGLRGAVIGHFKNTIVPQTIQMIIFSYLVYFLCKISSLYKKPSIMRIFKILKVVLFEVVKAIIDLLFERLNKTQRRGVAEVLTWQNIFAECSLQGQSHKRQPKGIRSHIVRVKLKQSPCYEI